MKNKETVFRGSTLVLTFKEWKDTMKNKFKKFFLLLIFIFLLSFGIKETYSSYEYWAHWRPVEWSLVFSSAVFGVPLIYFSYKFLKAKEWKELIDPSTYVFLGFSLRCFSSILHIFGYAKEDYPWITSEYIMASYFEIILLILIGAIAIFLCFKLNNLKRSEKFDVNKLLSCFSLIPLLYALLIFIWIYSFLVMFSNQPYLYEGIEVKFNYWHLIYTVLYLFLALSLILLTITLSKKRIDLVKIPLIIVFVFYGVDYLRIYLSILMYSFEIYSLLISVVGILSIVLAFAILNLDMEEIKKILTERYKLNEL